MREFLSYDEIYGMLKGDMGDALDEKRFAISALSARIYEELVLWKRLNKLLEGLNKHPLEPEEWDEYGILSKKSESLTQLIVRSVKELGIENKKSVKELINTLDERMLGGTNDDETKRTNGTASDNS